MKMENKIKKIDKKINNINKLISDKLHQQSVLRLEIIELEEEKALLYKEFIRESDENKTK